MIPWGIRHQVLFLAVVPILTVSTLLVVYFTNSRLQDLEQNFNERNEAIAHKLAQACEYGIFSQNSALLETIGQHAIKEYDLQSITLYNEKGLEMTQIGNPVHHIEPHSLRARSVFPLKEEKLNNLALTVPIKAYQELDNHSDLSDMESLIGWIKIEFDTKSIHLRESQLLIHTGIILFFGLIISVLHAMQMGRKVTRPIVELSNAVKRIKLGDLSTRVKISTYQEFHILASGINTMAEALENAHRELHSKINEATANLRRSLETIEIQNSELELARSSAENLSKIKSEFLADMSHEIRTPLNAVVGFINLLKKTPLNDKQTEYVQTLARSSQTLLSIINDILDLSKIEAGKLKIEQRPMNIKESVLEVCALFSPAMQEKNLSLFFDISPDVPKQIVSDPLRIKQILTNLLSNAIKFTNTGSVRIRVLLEEDRRRQVLIRMSVTDTGMGLTQQEQQDLFQAFNQANIENTRKFGGTGLGLVICKKLVEQLQGAMDLESCKNHGSTFWFSFLADKFSEDTDSQFEERVPLNTNEVSGLHILAVDDNPENLKLIKILLEKMKNRVTDLVSGKAALEAVQTSTQRFDLILMDIRMPEMDGIETTHAIRQFEAEKNLKTTPVIALTAHAFINEKQALLAAGIDDYLMKPLDEQSLMTVLHKWARRHLNNAPPLKTLDWELAYKLAAGKKELAKELFEKLMQTLETSQNKINTVFQQSDWKTMRDLVHYLHGACCYCGVPELKMATQELESALNKQQLEKLPCKLKRFNQAITNLRNLYSVESTL